MRERMSLKARHELLSRISTRYGLGTALERKQILSQFVATTGYSRKHAIHLLNRPPVDKRAAPVRKRRYDEGVRQALVQLWKAANCICSKRLMPFLPELVDSMEKFGHLSLPPDVREKLLAMSAATADRLLARERRVQGQGLSTTRPGSLLKRQISVRTFADWDDVVPGFFEADLVAHCGDSVAGSFLHTLVLVDISTGWTECVALLRRSDADVIGALNAVRKVLPFPMLGLDTDNGSEFINYEMLRYCREEEITFTRSRAYRKNDQAHVEEKNGSVVRRMIGYDRYEGAGAWRILREFYSVLRLYQNFFQPSMKLTRKHRNGARVRKYYDDAKTPCQRSLSLNLGSTANKELARLRTNLDPLALLRKLERLQERFWKYAFVPSDEQSLGAEDIATAGVELAAASTNGSYAKRYPRRYRRTKKPRAPRTWRTRDDPFAGVWSEIRMQLELNPHQTAKELFRQLQQRETGKYKNGQLRTLQRRVREWRLQQYQSDCYDSGNASGS